MQTLDFTPASITVRVVVGSTVGFGIAAKRADGTPFDLSGYTITAPFLACAGAPPPVPAFTVVAVDASSISLSLTAAECALLGDGCSPVSWSWSCWADSPAQRLELVRGSLALSPP
jgi:hypothetical protein